MPYDPIQGQGQGHGGPKVTKMADFKVYLLCRYTVVSVPLSVECEANTSVHLVHCMLCS